MGAAHPHSILRAISNAAAASKRTPGTRLLLHPPGAPLLHRPFYPAPNPSFTAPSPSPPLSGPGQGWKPVPSELSLTRRLALYQALSKSRLSTLITLTTMASYALIPLGPSVPPTSVATLLATAAGTFFCSASANALNQIFEAPLDAQMSRTRGRPLARRAVSPHHAAVFASVAGASGSLLLAVVVNPATALVGVANLGLYAFVYTPLKRISPANTWLGALVGALPALMGSTAAGASLLDPASWLTTALLFVWQFPHFNSLAHSLRRDYARAGYQMMANLHPALNARVSLRYALATIPLSSWLVPLYGLTTWTFAFLSLVPNLALIIPALRFWIATPNGPLSTRLLRSPLLSSLAGPKAHARTHPLDSWAKKFESKANQQHQAKQLFWASLIHLPTLLILMMACRTASPPPPPTTTTTNDLDSYALEIST